MSGKLRYSAQVLVAALVGPLACQSVTAPAIVSVGLSSLAVGIPDGPIGPWILIEAETSAGASLADGEAIEVSLVTSRGDSLTVAVGPSLCANSTMVCNEVVVGFAPGADLSSIQSAISDLDAALTSASSIDGEPTFGVVYAFSGDLSAVIDALREHPGIEAATLNGTGMPGEVLGSGQFLRAVIPTLHMTPPPVSARINLGESDITVVATYRQPDGTVLQSAPGS
jgi:hypothetical protein